MVDVTRPVYDHTDANSPLNRPTRKIVVIPRPLLLVALEHMSSVHCPVNRKKSLLTSVPIGINMHPQAGSQTTQPT